MRKNQLIAKVIRRPAIAIMATVMAFLPASGLVQANPTHSERERIFSDAAAEFSVPEELLKSISYNQSRWENHDGQPSVSGGYGLMHLTLEQSESDARGKEAIAQNTPSDQIYTLKKAADIIGVNEDNLKQDDKQNVRGAAALLSEYAKSDNSGELPSSLGEWYSAVARFGDMNSKESAQEFADTVFKTINDGVSLLTTDNQKLSITPQSAQIDYSKLEQLGLPTRQPAHHDEGVECPHDLVCKWVPARFAQNNPDSPYDYGNYDEANREQDMDIRYIVIHTIEGSYQSAIDWYQNPASYVSVQYTIRSSDGEVTQSVKNKDVAWQAGNWYTNTHSIGIEHEGYAAEGSSWYTDAMYRSSAKLVRYLAAKYDIPLDREHIIGHDQIPGVSQASVPTMHWDPGPYWDWDHYMNLLHRPTVPTAGPFSDAVTIAPRFDQNKPVITQCENDACKELPSNPANFVYLRTEPRHDAPLLGDDGLHPDGSASTTQVGDWGAKATHGQRFAVADRQGDWTAIWFGGKKGWFYNPGWLWGKNALPARAKLITPKPGKSEIAVYGRPAPEAQAYPDIENIPILEPAPLQYKIMAGQKYVTYDPDTVNDYFLVWAFDRSNPGDGEVIIGDVKYLPIMLNHRVAFVRADDVKVLH